MKGTDFTSVTFSNELSIPQDNLIGENPNINELSCFICLGVAFKPMMLTCCERILCLYCLNAVIKAHTNCPICKEKVTFQKASKFVLRLYDNLFFSCPAESCKERVNYFSFFRHVGSDCKFKLSSVQFCKDCGEIYQHKENSSHVCYELFKSSDESNDLQQSLVSLFLKEKVKFCEIGNSELHRHKLMLTNQRGGNIARIAWICDICEVKFEKSVNSFYCKDCDYDVCEKCVRIVRRGKANKDNHFHRLKLTLRRLNWVCDCCKSRLRGSSWYCSLCDFDVCINCYWRPL